METNWEIDGEIRCELPKDGKRNGMSAWISYQGYGYSNRSEIYSIH